MQLEVLMSAGSDYGLGVPAPMWHLGAAWMMTPDQTLCLVEISLTHMKNIELSRWLVVLILVKGKRERHYKHQFLL